MAWLTANRDLYITDAQLTKRGGQWCISWFWPGIRVLNSHGFPCGSTQGWREFESCISGHPCFFIFLLHLGEQRWEETKKKKERQGEWLTWNGSHVPKIPVEPPAAGTRETRSDWGWHQSQTHWNGWVTAGTKRLAVQRVKKPIYSDVPGCISYLFTWQCCRKQMSGHEHTHTHAHTCAHTHTECVYLKTVKVKNKKKREFELFFSLHKSFSMALNEQRWELKTFLCLWLPPFLCSSSSVSTAILVSIGR